MSIYKQVITWQGILTTPRPFTTLAKHHTLRVSSRTAYCTKCSMEEIDTVRYDHTSQHMSSRLWNQNSTDIFNSFLVSERK